MPPKFIKDNKALKWMADGWFTSKLAGVGATIVGLLLLWGIWMNVPPIL